MWQFKTSKGIFQIRRMPSGKFGIIFSGDCLGEYQRPADAAYEIANGHSFWPSFGDPSGLGIPEELGDWEQLM